MDLSAIPIPRPREVVDEVTAPMLARSKSLSRWSTLIMLLVGVACGLMMFTSHPASSADATNAQMFLIVSFFCGALPAAAVYVFFSSAMKRAPELVRTGEAIAGRIVSFLDGGGAKYFTIAWPVKDGTAQAKLKAANVGQPMRDGDPVTVLVSPKIRNQVGVVLGSNGLYVADMA